MASLDLLLSVVLVLDGVQLAHCESEDATMHRALYVLNGQALTEIEIEPADGRTRFSFDLGCSLLTLPAEASVYENACNGRRGYAHRCACRSRP